MAKNNIKVKKEEIIVGKRRYKDLETGEIIEMAGVAKEVNQDVGFHKVWLQDLLKIIENFGDRKLLVVGAILEMMDSKNKAIFYIKTLAEEAGVSTRTAQAVVTKLMELNILKRDERLKSLYMLNPDFIAQGSTGKRYYLCVEYTEGDFSNV